MDKARALWKQWRDFTFHNKEYFDLKYQQLVNQELPTCVVLREHFIRQNTSYEIGVTT